MSIVVTIAGSPSEASRSAAVLAYARSLLEARGLLTHAVHVREVDPEALLFARFDHPSLKAVHAKVAEAQALIIATPVYKAAYSGVLKALLDTLPQNALAGKTVLPIATGGSPAHLLAIDYAVKPVLSALGAEHILNGVYILDSQLQTQPFELHTDADHRLRTAIHNLSSALHASRLLTSLPQGV